MNRRNVLTTLGSLSIATVAGCSGSGGAGSDTPTEPPADTPTASPSPSPTPNAQALDRYQAAVETLLEVKDTLDKWTESSVNNIEQVRDLQARVASARDDLDAAEEHAAPDGELIAKVEQTHYVADFQDLSLAYYEGVLQLIKLLSEGTRLGDNERHQRASDTFADARQLTEDLQPVIDDMETVLDELDTDALDEPDLAYTGEPFDHLEGHGREAINGVVSYLEGREYFHLSFVYLEDGQKFMDAEEFTQGREAWETGRSHVETAKSAFNAAIDNSNTPEDLRDTSFALLGVCNGLLDAFDKFVAGAKEAEAGNTDKAQTLIGEGYDILDQTFEE